MSSLPYDKSSPTSIEQYAKLLVGHTFQDVLNGVVGKCQPSQEKAVEYNNPSRKGGLGNLLEEVYFEYKANSDSRPDFEEAGVELKATPYEYNKNGTAKAGERLVLSMINYSGEIEPTLEESHVCLSCVYDYKNGQRT